MPERAPIMDLLGISVQTRASARERLKAFLDPSRDARELLLDETGAMKPAAVRLFRRLVKESGMDRLDFEPDGRRQEQRIGEQRIVLFMLDMLSLNQAKFMRLQQELGDAE